MRRSPGAATAAETSATVIGELGNLERVDNRLTLAFFDGFSRRPEDLAPAPKKVVLVLAPARVATP